MSRIDSDVSSPVVLDRHCRYPTGIGKTKAGWVNSRVLFDWCNVNIQCPFEQYTEVQTAHAREHLALSLQQKLGSLVTYEPGNETKSQHIIIKVATYIIKL